MSDGHNGHHRVVLIISQRLTCGLLATVLGKQASLRVVGATVAPAVGLDLVSQHRAHVVVVDAQLPEDGAFRAMEAIATHEHYARTLVLGGAYTLQVQRSLSLGAAGFFTYDDSAEELAEGIAQLASGGYSFCRSLADAITITPKGPRIARNGLPGDLAELTDREIDVLSCLVNGDSVRVCARRLDLSESTVDNHKTRMMRKLNVHRTVDLVRLAIRDRLVPVW